MVHIGELLDVKAALAGQIIDKRRSLDCGHRKKFFRLRRLCLWPFPLAGVRGAENRLNHGHIINSVRKRNWHFATLAYRAGKGVALNRVLVTSVKSLGYDLFADAVAAFGNEYSTWPVIGSIEWNLDFNAALRSQEMKPLIGSQLSAARKSGVPGRKIEDGEVPVSISDGINNMAVIEAIFRSADSGQWERP